MSDPLSGGEPKRSLLERLSSMLVRAPDDRSQLLNLLRQAHERDLLDADAISMIEGVMQVSDLAVRDLMVPRSQMGVIDITQSPAEFIPHVVATAHSRFPVVDGDRDNVIGILHAKDLLRLYATADVFALPSVNVDWKFEGYGLALIEASATGLPPTW